MSTHANRRVADGIVFSQTKADPHEDAGASEDLSAHFKHNFRHHPAGVALITADIGNGPVALTATSVTSLSAAPPLIAFSVSDSSSSTPTITEASTVVIHLLNAEQIDLAKLGATSGIDRFADTTLWTRMPTGEAYFPSAAAWFRSKVIERIRAGSSTMLIVEVLQDKLNADHDASPLVYQNQTWHQLGNRSSVS